MTLDAAPAPSPRPAQWRARLTRFLAFARTEYGVVVLALSAIGLHIADDNYFQPARGTSPLDHLASGLIPLAILAAVAAGYPHLRAGLRATTAMTFGVLGIAVGVPGVYYLVEGEASGDHYTGPLALAGGIALLLTGPVVLWRSRRRGGSRRRRYLGRAATVATTAVAIPVLFSLVAFPIGFSYIYTHTGRTAEPPALGAAYESVTVPTSDGLELSASYVPSKNGAAVVVYPGLSAVEEGAMLARHGYGVLLLDPRGQGASEGDTVRWQGDRDLIAGAKYLQRRPDVDDDRVAGFGSSVGGEQLLEAAAQSTAFSAVVSEGAGERVGEVDESGFENVLSTPVMAVMTAATTVFGNDGPPPPIVDRIGLIAPRPVFLIYADPGMGGESSRQPKYYAAAGEPKQMWKVPGSGHTGGLEAQPAEFERRVVAFLDRSLLG
jgi:pimeloyl-ACP methyl ester carboxylesterase